MANSEQLRGKSDSVERFPWFRRLALFLSLATVGCGLDLWTKHRMFEWRGLPQPDVDNTWWLWEGYVGIQTSVNQGALFGMGQGGSGWFAVLSVLAAAWVVGWLFFWKGARELVPTIALGCVTGGILGNLYDRLGLWHDAEVAPQFRNGVRDWILWRYGEYTWPNFNIADSLLVCGGTLLVVHVFWPRKSSSPAENDAGGKPTEGKKREKNAERSARETAPPSAPLARRPWAPSASGQP